MKSHSKSSSLQAIAKRASALDRKLARNARTDEEQLALLVARGAGSCDEALKIHQRLFRKEDPTNADKQVGGIDPAEATAALKAFNKSKRPARKRRAVPASLM